MTQSALTNNIRNFYFKTQFDVRLNKVRLDFRLG